MLSLPSGWITITPDGPLPDLRRVSFLFRFRQRLIHVTAGNKVESGLADRILDRRDHFILAGNLANAHRPDRQRHVRDRTPEEHHDTGDDRADENFDHNPPPLCVRSQMQATRIWGIILWSSVLLKQSQCLNSTTLGIRQILIPARWPKPLRCRS